LPVGRLHVAGDFWDESTRNLVLAAVFERPGVRIWDGGFVGVVEDPADVVEVLDVAAGLLWDCAQPEGVGDGGLVCCYDYVVALACVSLSEELFEYQ
jgi:hypothetical protein